MFRGMDMNGKKKFLIALLSLIALSLVLGHFGSYTVWAFGKTVAAGLVVLLVFLKFLAGISSLHLFL